MNCISSKKSIYIYKYFFLPFIIFLFLIGSFGFFVELMTKKKVFESIAALMLCLIIIFVSIYIQQIMVILYLDYDSLKYNGKIVYWTQVKKICCLTFIHPHFLIIKYTKNNIRKKIITILPLSKTQCH